MSCDIVHQRPVVGNDIIKTGDLRSDADDRRRFIIGQQIFYKILGNTFMDKRVIAQDDTVIIMDVRQCQYALKTIDMERVRRRHGADSEDIDPVALFAGIVIQSLQNSQSKVSIHVADKNTNFHDIIILGVMWPEKTVFMS